MREAPSSQQMVVSCRCGHAWLEHFLTNVDVRIWSAHLKTMTCPKCGKGHRSLALGGQLPEQPELIAAARRATSDTERRAIWKALHDNGLSSECIADRMCGGYAKGDHPHDGADFGRCYRLLKLYPEWRARLGEMAPLSPYWAALAGRWDEIEAAYLADVAALGVGNKRSSLCWDLMRSILDPVQAVDKRISRLGSGITIEFGEPV